MSKITLDKLATMIQSEFSNAQSEFGNIHSEFKNIRSEFKHVHETLSSLKDSVDSIDAKLSAQTTSWQQDFDKLESRVFQNENDISALNKIVLKKKS